MRKPAANGKGSKSHWKLSPEALVRRLEECWDEPNPPDAVRPDAEQLQGVWSSIDGPRGLDLLVAGSHFAVRFTDGTVYMGAFELDNGLLPKTMVMRIDEGPSRHRGKTAHCIYELDGRTLRWYLPEPGPRERPTAFPKANDPRYLFVVLRRNTPD
jgi:uncharacterized protein (TIGR03067 family)